MATKKYLDNTGLAYFWSKIKSWVTSRGYITSSGSITGNAGTATKLATARSISAGNLEFQGSANFDGSGNIALNVTNHRSIVSVGNRNNYPFHRIAHIPTLTGNYADRGITFLVSKDFHGGGWGICRIILRTNNATDGQTAVCNVQWLVRSGEISADSIQVGFRNTANASYIDVFYKSAGTYHSAVCRVLAHSNGRNSVGRGFTVVSTSTEVNSTTATDPKTSVESYKTIADAGTALHNQAYTDIIAASVVGVVGSCAGNAGTATKFVSAQSVALTGDVTGSASSQAGWSIATTLANSGVTAGRYTSVSVDAKGRVTAGNVKHSYTVAKSAAKNWYRLANANTSQTDASKTLHAQFIVTAYNTGQDTGYYERWFVDCEVFGRNAGIRIFGNTAAPFSQARVLYENAIANIDANDRPAIDLYLNNVMNNAATTVTVEEVYNSGWTFVADGQISASTVPTGFESLSCSVRGNGVERSTYADYVPYLNRQVNNITAAFTLSDSNTYRSRTLNCTGTFTITIPSINSGYMWCVIKNKNTTSGVITLHPSTTSVLIDGSNANITLQPGEYVCIHSAGANSYSLIADGRWKTQCIHLPTNVSNPERTVLCADGVWRDISQIAFPIF